MKKNITDRLFGNSIAKAVELKTQALFNQMRISSNAPTYAFAYDGEKNTGELGIIRDYYIDYDSLRARSWQAYTESELARIVINNHLLWVVGTGLKFKYEPDLAILKYNEIELRDGEVQTVIEALFNSHLNSKNATTPRMKTVHQMVHAIKLHAIVGGDVLVLMDASPKRGVTMRFADGALVASMNYKNAETGNDIIHGVEVNEHGEHIAFWVRATETGEVKRIAARTERGTVQAFMFYANEYRVGSTRGMPLLDVCLEKISKLDRYTEATVGAAEEVSKMPIVVEHSQHSTGQDPFEGVSQFTGRPDASTRTSDATMNAVLQATASNIKYTTGKTVINGVVGSSIKTLDYKGVISYPDFFRTNFDILCATVGIPPEVAMNKYDTSFIASQGARGNWEYRLDYEREKVDIDIYQPFFTYWLEVKCYQKADLLPAYLVAVLQGNDELIAAFTKCRHVGRKIPFLDQLKEAKAARLRLGDETTPLTTYEDACESLNTGEYKTLVRQAGLEKKQAINNGFEEQNTKNLTNGD